ncbi:DIS3-like exonuclease 2 [Harpegnathos saltator]|uniref:DIS3-like exonuclease 2 n=1 Tax=Harpegnathos saltator TaxID=610380 RepID=E2BZ80_HARSA|nr:DIS3-like exonuclease 2 [Harpegnathos saltator]EFN78986.1 DIS3-like exonuclease 2 [Harpegnathos saltator]
MPRDLRQTMKKVRRGSRGKRQDITSFRYEQKMILDSMIDGTDAVQNNVLMELGAQLASKLKVSANFKLKQERAKSNRTAMCETQEQVASNSSGYETDIMRMASTLWVSSSSGSVASNTTHNSIMQDESESTEEEKETNDIRTSATTNHLKIDTFHTCRSMNKDVTLHENDARTMSDKPQNIALNCKSKLKLKVELDKVTATNCLCSCQIQEKHSVTNQADICSKSPKKSKKNKIAMREFKENTQKECCCIKEETEKNCATKKTKNAREITQQLSENMFSDYIPVPEMKKILENQTFDNIQYVKGTIRVNPKYNHFAYISMIDGERDLLINSIIDRNRAFDGDLVVARINPEENWQILANGKIQKTGTVICILDKLHPRKAIGYLTQHVRKCKPYVLIKPKDIRIPLIRIPSKSMPNLYHKQPNLYNNVIFLIVINHWTQPSHASGEILQIVGESGDLNAEVTAILLENNLDVSPYRQELLQGLPDSDYVLTNADIMGREDWSNECVFTIDPATAVDLDDAVSCKVLKNGNYEVGVHISDVTHYLELFSPLDKAISKRATTVYLPHTSYHMLPEQLCRVCSLLPGKDKLAFSVIWELTPDGEIVEQRFAKTVIRSCCQLSYDLAQIMIDNPEEVLSDKVLDIKGNFTALSLSNTVNNLFKLSTSLRNKRFSNGALSLDQPKIHICMDPKIMREHGISVPVNYQLEERRDSNRLIEEFMLLANMTVAAQLYSTIPETALLRIHRDPIKHSLVTIHETLRKYGIHLDIETAGALNASIQRYERDLLECNSSTMNNTMQHVIMVITNLCSKAMTRAEYKCASAVTSSDDLKHYALNVPLYTHFTSPIRRYSDCIVHRLLYATIANKPMPRKWTAKLCSRISNNCNVKKYNAKLAQEQSTELFFVHMVGLAGSFEALAIVAEIKERNMDVILCDTGIKLKIYFKDIKHTVAVKYSADLTVPTVTIQWKTLPVTQIINMFSSVRVRVEKMNEDLRLKATLIQ